MPLFKFNSHPAPGYHADGSFVVQDAKLAASLKTRKKVTADICGGGGAGTGSGGYGSGMGGSSFGTGMGGGAGTFGDPGLGNTSFGGGMSGATVDRYNPIRDRLDEGSIVEDWIPRDASGLDEMFKLMYNRDHIAGVVVDLIAELLWSDFDLVGVQDPVILNIYRDTMMAIDPLTIGPELAREYLVIGRTASSMIFNKEKGIFNDIISHDPSFLRLTPIPMKGFDPKIDLIPSPAMRAFVESNDPRDIDARKSLPAAYIAAIKAAGSGGGGSSTFRPSQQYSGAASRNETMGIPLDPINTLFLPRKTFGYDNIGTSLYTRLITFWALEKALINATMSSARRRSRSILHVTTGIDNVWEPTAQEMDNIAGMFIQADEDPVGAVVATRTGVSTNEIRSGQDFYKWSDEWALLNEGKLRALGANDALLTGDATYNNQESARMFFMEKVLRLRETLTQRIFYNKLFPLIARIHGFQKRTTAELNHRIRLTGDSKLDNSVRLTQRQALEIPSSELIVPTISWRKELVNNVNENKINIYEKLEEKGIPIHLRDWAAAGNIDLDFQMSALEDDANLRQQVNKWKQSYESPEGEGDAEANEARLQFIESLRNLSHSNLKQALGSTIQELGPLSSYIFWSSAATLGPLKASELISYLKTISPEDNSYKVLADPMALRHRLMQHFQNNIKAEIAHYLIYRSGLTQTKPTLTNETISLVSSQIKSSLDQYAVHGQVYQLSKVAENELSILGALSENRMIKKRGAIDKNAQNMDRMIRQKAANIPLDKISNMSSNLFSGV
jgi:hypothetical protein